MDLLKKCVILALTLAVSPAVVSQAAPLRQAQTPQPAQDRRDGEEDRAAALKKYLEAQRQEQAGNYPAAVAAYREAIELDPKSVELRVALGNLYLKNRNVIDAEAQAAEAVKLAPSDASARKLIAQVYIAQSVVGTSINKEKVRAAIRELEEVAKADPRAKIGEGENEAPVLAVVGDLYYRIDEPDKAIEALKRVSEGDATSDMAHYQLAFLYFQKNRYREAAAAARKAYEIKKDQPVYAGLLAKSLQRIGRTQEALDIYKQALGIKDDQPTDDKAMAAAMLTHGGLLAEYAEALVAVGRYDEAMKRLDPVLKVLRKDTPVYLNYVNIYADALRRSGKREEAIRTLEEAVQGQDVSDSLGALYSLAETYEEVQKFDKAVETYEEALSAIVNPDGTTSGREQDKNNAGLILRRIALAYRLAGDRDKMMATYERVRKVLGEDSPLADQLIIGSLMDEGRYQEAMERAKAAEAKFPDERAFKLLRAQAAGRLGDAATAEQIVQPLLKGSAEDADLYVFLASVHLDANQLSQAEARVRKAVELEPRDVGPLITLSIVQDRQKKYKDSEATLRKALEIDPDNATVLNNLGYFLTERREKLQEAEELIRRAVNIEPTNGSFLDSLGWLLYQQGKLQEAQKYLEQAVSYSPRSATIHDHLGDLYKKQGQLDKARAKWEEALKLATEPDEIKSIKEKLNKK